MEIVVVALIVGLVAFVQGYMACKKEWDREKLSGRNRY